MRYGICCARIGVLLPYNLTIMSSGKRHVVFDRLLHCLLHRLLQLVLRAAA